MATINQKLGLRIKKFRQGKRMTQEVLAELAKIDYTYLNMIESGKKNPTIKILAKIARVLGVSTRELLP